MKTVRRPQASKGWQSRKYKEEDERSLKILKKKNKLNECKRR